MNNDLISRAALKVMFEKECPGGCGNCPHNEPDFSCGLISAAPAVEAEPVRHGRWLNEPPYRSIGGDYLKAQECSECGAYYVSDGNKPYSNHNYCADCGAKMDGELKRVSD